MEHEADVREDPHHRNAKHRHHDPGQHTLPEGTPINELVNTAHQRWRIERDYQDLKQDFGLGHCKGRGWRGFHHHASLSITDYRFLKAERLIADEPMGSKKT